MYNKHFPIHWNEFRKLFTLWIRKILNATQFDFLFILTIYWRDQIIIYSYSCPLFDANAVVHNSFKFRSGTLCIQSFNFMRTTFICKSIWLSSFFWRFSKNSYEFKRRKIFISCFYKRKKKCVTFNIIIICNAHGTQFRLFQYIWNELLYSLSFQRMNERWNISFISMEKKK